jgi:hypothetical protein
MTLDFVKQSIGKENVQSIPGALGVIQLLIFFKIECKNLEAFI